MSNPRELALALAVTTVIADAAKERKDQLRVELLQALDQLGADAVRAELPDGTRVAKTSIVAPATKPSVSDERAFVSWVEQMSPGEIVRSVRDSYKRVLLERLAPTSDGLAVDPETGELVPGVSFRQSSPYVSTRFDKGGRESVIDALRAGSVALDLAAAPQLEGGQG